MRVIGELNAFKTSRNLKITQIVPIDGPYEVYYHTLSVIYEAVALEKGLPVSLPVFVKKSYLIAISLNTY